VDVLTEWLSLIIRWTHVVAGIAWIGSSFYFIHLDLSLRPRDGLPDGVKGEAWQVHGGGFYHMVKYLVAPARMPDHLTWFKWEAYATWLSGFALLVLVYYMGAELYLIDKTVMDLTAPGAAAVAFFSLAAAWLAYEGLCRSPLGKYEGALAFVGFIFLVGLTFAFTHVFSGRGAFTQIGALIGTIMVANVFAIIIPNQRKIIAALVAGETPDPALGEQGKQRSVHNNYLTLPVIFLMISNHYPLLYATKYNWLIVAIVLLVGPIIRHYYNTKHEGKEEPLWPWAAAAIGMMTIAWLSWVGAPETKTSAATPRPDMMDVENIVLSRCSMCHSSEPVWAGVAHPPRGVVLDTPERIRLHARLINIWAVRSHAMPPGNITDMTDEERGTLAAWLAEGNKMQ